MDWIFYEARQQLIFLLGASSILKDWIDLSLGHYYRDRRSAIIPVEISFEQLYVLLEIEHSKYVYPRIKHLFEIYWS